MDRRLIVDERLDLQPAHPTHEGKIADATVDIVAVENGKPLLPGESRVTKDHDQRRQLGGREMRLRLHR